MLCECWKWSCEYCSRTILCAEDQQVLDDSRNVSCSMMSGLSMRLSQQSRSLWWCTFAPVTRSARFHLARKWPFTAGVTGFASRLKEFSSAFRRKHGHAVSTFSFWLFVIILTLQRFSKDRRLQSFGVSLIFHVLSWHKWNLSIFSFQKSFRLGEAGETKCDRKLFWKSFKFKSLKVTMIMQKIFVCFAEKIKLCFVILLKSFNVKMCVFYWSVA